MTFDWEYPTNMTEKAMHDTVTNIAEISYQTGLRRAIINHKIKAEYFPGQQQL